MKNTIKILILALLFMGCKEEKTKINEHNHIEHQAESTKVSDKKPLSPHTSAMAMIGDAHVHIDYSSPGVRGRIVFGGLLPYNEVWQSGAHMATWVETNKDLLINEQILKAGKYGFFTIPSKDEWTVIFNSNWNQHGKDDYNEKEDILRFKVKPENAEVVKEHLAYEVKEVAKNEGTISLAWENILIRFNFKVNE